MFNGIILCKWPFSIAMLNYQRVPPIKHGDFPYVKWPEGLSSATDVNAKSQQTKHAHQQVPQPSDEGQTQKTPGADGVGLSMAIPRNSWSSCSLCSCDTVQYCFTTSSAGEQRPIQLLLTPTVDLEYFLVSSLHQVLPSAVKHPSGHSNSLKSFQIAHLVSFCAYHFVF